MSALVGLRCIDRDTKVMLLANNADDVGDFDDIVLLKESTGGSRVAYLVQLKHKENPKDLTSTDFLSNLTKTKDFKLSKYSKSFHLLQDKLGAFTKPESDFIDYLRKVDRIIFVLFTNRGVEECQFLKRYQDVDLSFLQTGNLNSDVYGFDCTQLQEYNPEFLKNLFLLANQSNVDGLDLLIEKEFERIINPLKLIDEGLTNVNLKFATFIETWIQSKVKEQYFLRKPDIIGKLISLFLDRFKVRLSDNSNNSLQINIFHEICCAHTMTIVDWNQKVFHFLVRYLAGRLENYCGRNEPTENRKKQEKKYWGTSFQRWDNNLRQQLKDSLYRKHEGFREYMIKFEGNSENLTFSDLYQYLWLTHQLPLLLEVNKLEDFQSILRILEVSQFSFRVILFNKTGKTLPKTDATLKRFETLEDLSETHKKNILSQEIKLQGKPVLLRDIVDNSMFKNLSSNDLIDILLQNFNIGNVYEIPSDYLIERTLYRVLLKPSVLENTNNELFVIEKQPKSEFTPMGLFEAIKFGDVGSSDLDEKNIIIADDDDNLKETQLQHLYEFSRKTVHWLLFHGKNQLEWKKTLGSTKNISFYRLEEREDYNLQCTYTTEEIFLLPNSTNILSASPGMGKSTLMNFLAHQAPKDVWILNVNLNLHDAYYDSEECQNCETPASVHLNRFCKYIFEKHGCNTKLAEAVFQKMLDAKKVFVLLDGFDEISIFFKDEVTNIAKCLQREGFKMWITTRPIMKSHLEEELDSISTTLKPFTMDDQEKFLEKYFTAGNASKTLTVENRQIMKRFIKKLLAVAAVNLNDRDREFMGIPLQIKLLAEAFNADYLKTIDTSIVKFNKVFDLLDLYESFVKTKISILRIKHGVREKKEFERYQEYQSLSALKVLFKHQLLQKLNIDDKLQRCEEFLGVGFLQKGGIMLTKNEFVHRTYPEYLSGKWLAENLHHQDDTIRRTVIVLLNERFNQQYKFLFNIFDRIVCKDCDVHVCIINGQLEEAIEGITISRDSIVSEDTLGRSLLHTVALYGEFSPSLTFYEYLKKLNRDTKSTVAQLVELVLNNECADIKNDKLGFSPLDYAIANGSLEIANKLCAKYKEIEIKVGLYDSLRAKYFLYCAKMDYEHLFKTLLKHFSYNTLALGNNEPLDKYCVQCCEKLIPQMTNKILEKLHGYIKTFVDNDLTYIHGYKTDPNFDHTGIIYNNMHLATASLYNVELLLIKGSEIDKQDAFLRTPLHYAVWYNNPDVVILLLQKGALINTIDIEGNTPLHYALSKKLLHIANILLEKGAKVNIKNKYGITVLQLAMESSGEDLKALFLEKGVTEEAIVDSIPYDDGAIIKILVDRKIIDILIDCAFHQTSSIVYNDQLSYNDNLYEDITESNLLALEKYISSGGDVNMQNHLGITALHWAVRQKNVEAVKFLLSHKADVNIPNSEGETPLYCSLREDLDDISLLLVSEVEESRNFSNESSASLFNSDIPVSNINKNNLSATTANRIVMVSKHCMHQENCLILAIKRRKENIVKLLIAKGVNVNAVDDEGKSALHCAVMDDSPQICSDLLRAGADVNKQDLYENTALHYAIATGNIFAMAFLLAGGADIAILDHKGNTALHYAALYGSEGTTSFVLHVGTGAEINKKNKAGQTPLFFAADRGQVDIVGVLLANGADVSILDIGENTVLHAALGSGSHETVLALIDAGAEVNRQNAKNCTPLHVAVVENRLKIAKLLLARGADVNIIGSENNTALHFAAEFGSQDMIVTLLKAGIEIDSLNAFNHTPLHTAILKHRMDNVKLLLAKSADLDAHILDPVKNSALHYAASYSSQEIISELLVAGAKIDRQNAENSTPLHLAISAGRTDNVMLLLANGANVNIPDNNKHTALHAAASFGSQTISSANVGQITELFEIDKKNANKDTSPVLENYINDLVVSFRKDVNLCISSDSEKATLLGLSELVSQNIILALLDAGSEVNQQNANNSTPLYFAALKGYTSVVKLLLANGADANIRDIDGKTVLHIAAEFGLQDIVSALLDGGSEINGQDVKNNTPLHLAALKDNFETVKVLLARGADHSIAGLKGFSVLHCAAMTASQNTISVILKAGADINRQTSDGVVPLLLAIWSDRVDVVKVLLANGADISIVDCSGNTVLQAVLMFASQEIISTVLEAGVDINLQNAEGYTPLHLAISKDRLDIVKFLFANGADTNITDCNGNAVLHYAVQFASQEVISAILTVGGNINHRNAQGAAPLFLAALKDRLDIVKLLLAHGADINIVDCNGDTVLHREVMSASQAFLEADINVRNAKGFTPLHQAISKDRLGIVKFLLANGADINIADCDGNTALHFAVVFASQELVSTFLEAGAGINVRNTKGLTPLHQAIWKDRLDIVKFLLTNGADINIVDCIGNTALHGATRFASQEMILTLLQAGTGINEQNVKGRSPLLTAILNGRSEVVKCFIANGANINIADCDGNTVLHFAVVFCSQEIVLKVFEAGAGINVQNARGLTPLHRAIWKDRLDIVKFLLANGADINIADTNGITALHGATVFASQEMILTLLQAGTDINGRDVKGKTPLLAAISNGRSEVAKCLIANGADVNIVDCDENTVLHFALVSASQELVSTVLEVGADINAQNARGLTPLHQAISKDRLNVVKVLLANGASINIADCDGNTVMHFAAEFASQETVSTVLEAGVGINLQNAKGFTPLHRAVWKDRLDVVKFLLANGASINIADCKGNTTLHVATVFRSQEMISTLLKPATHINVQNAVGETPLLMAISSGRSEVVKCLIANGADVNIADCHGDTALHYTALTASREIISTVLEAGADINKQNAKGLTPLHRAIFIDRFDIVKFLLTNGADIAIVENYGNTALHIAAGSGSHYMVIGLLEAGSQINQQNAENDTPIHLAVSRGQLDIVALLLAQGADINILGCNENTVLHNAVRSGVFEVTSVLLDAGADAGINHRNAKNETPLHLAVCNKQLEHVKVFLAKGADINIPNGNGKTALQIARELGCQDMVLELLKTVTK